MLQALPGNSIAQAEQRGVNSTTLGSIAVSMLLLLLPGAPAPAAGVPANAPVDEAFGKTYKLTVLAIHNHAICLAYRMERSADAPQSELHHGQLMEEAIEDWEQQYPRDADLPRDIMLLEIAYGKARGYDAELRLNLMRTWLRSRYPESREAQMALAAVRAAKPGECHMTRDAFDNPPGTR